MSSTTRICRRTTCYRGMWVLLNALTLVYCSSLIDSSPVVGYNEKSPPNSAIAISTSTTADAGVSSDNATLTTNISEEPFSFSPSTSSSSLIPTPPTSTILSFSSTSIDVSNVTKVPQTTQIPDTDIPFTSFPADNQTSAVTEQTSAPLNASVGEFSYSESNLTKINGSADEGFLKSVAADSVFNVTVIAGISALVIFIAVLIGVTSFVLYRHFSWNRPQTLSDKFSNDESTGYIDDSAFRENSEEMYSLDNDSFLNSLEAMTIQNYWTDHVKHTKL